MSLSIMLIADILHGLNAEMREKVLVAAAKEFAAHKVDPEETPLMQVADAWVDATYYLADTLHRLGYEMPADVMSVDVMGVALNAFLAVGNFTKNVADVELAHEMTVEEKWSKICFVLSMVLSEMLESTGQPGDEVKGRVQLDAWVDRTSSSSELLEPDRVILMLALVFIQLINEAMTFWPGLYSILFREVHMANMRKGVHSVDADGTDRYTFEVKNINGTNKVIKPAGWVGPDMKSAMRKWVAGGVLKPLDVCLSETEYHAIEQCGLQDFVNNDTYLDESGTLKKRGSEVHAGDEHGGE